MEKALSFTCKLIPICTLIHEYSHYYMARIMNLKVIELVTHKINPIDGTHGGHVRIEMPTVIKDFTIIFRIRFLAVVIAPIIPFSLIVFVFYKLLMLLIYNYSLIMFLVSYPVLALCVLMIGGGVRVGGNDWKRFFLILGTFVGIVKIVDGNSHGKPSSLNCDDNN